MGHEDVPVVPAQPSPTSEEAGIAAAIAAIRAPLEAKVHELQHELEATQQWGMGLFGSLAEFASLLDGQPAKRVEVNVAGTKRMLEELIAEVNQLRSKQARANNERGVVIPPCRAKLHVEDDNGGTTFTCVKPRPHNDEDNMEGRQHQTRKGQRWTEVPPPPPVTIAQVPASAKLVLASE